MTTSTTKALRLGITDAGALLLIYLLPTLSHITSVPFYLLDPMRIAVLGALLCTRDWKNSLVLAVTLRPYRHAPHFPEVRPDSR